jgi:hypothetical protein
MARAKVTEIQPIDPGPADSAFDLTLYNRSRVLLVNMISNEHSDETEQNSEPFLAVHPDGQLLVGAAYTFSDNPPLYVSQDAGWTWERRAIIPVGSVWSQSFCFSGTGKTLYGAVLGGAYSPESNPTLSVLETRDPSAEVPMKVISVLGSREGLADQPFIQARAFTADRIYVGQNYFGPELASGQTASVRVSTDGGRRFRLLGVEARPTSVHDAPSVRPAIATDGTVYVAFIRWTSSVGKRANMRPFRGDVVVTRDDEGAAGSKPFQSLKDSADGKPGRLVAQGRVFPFDMMLGGQRVGSSLSLAVDPNDSSSLYIAWADLDPSTKAYTIHLRRSTDRGQNWSDDLLTVQSATNPALAVSSAGILGILYQAFVNGRKRDERWETHFQWSLGGYSAWTDILLTSFPTTVGPKPVGQPYLGDKVHLLSLAGTFYGVFSAPNIPERKYFPQGVHFQRRHRDGKLLSNNGRLKIAPSIDPYFFRVCPDSNPVVSRGVERLIAEFKGPVLTNYSGFVTASFVDEEGCQVREARPGQVCRLRVHFGQTQPSESWAERIDIRGGDDAPQVAFKLVIDTDDTEVTPDSMIAVVTQRGTGEAIFNVVTARAEGRHSLFVQVFQKTRLIQVVALTLMVREKK